jgi:hypothetical protein
MTNHEYISATLSQFSATDELVRLVEFKGGANPDAFCDVSVCNKAILDNESLIRLNTKRSVSEGGMSISWQDADKLLDDFFNGLAESVGEHPRSGSVIRDASDLW